MTKYAGRQMELLRGNGVTPTEAFAVIGQVTSIDNVGSTRGLIDASAYGDDWMDYVTGQQDGAEITVGFAYDPASTAQEDVLGDYDDGIRHNYQLRHTPSTFHVQFPVLVTSVLRGPGGGPGGLLQMQATFKILNPGVTDVVP